jgi:HlyD family secretion protein
MKQSKRTFIYAFIVACLLLAGCGRRAQPTPVPTASSESSLPAAVQAGGAIRALGSIQPAQTLQLSFGASAPIESVAARVGAEVSAGDVLAGLDTAQLALELSSAEQEVAYWQAALEALTGGPDPAQVERVEAEHAQQVAEAEIALQVAQEKLAQARQQDHGAEVIVARTEARQLELQLAQARAASPAAAVDIAQVNLARAQDTLAAAQEEYRKALDRPWEPQHVRDALVKAIQRAQWEVEVAQAQLEDAQRAQRAYTLQVEALETSSDIAQAHVTQALGAQAAYSTTLQLLAADVALAEVRLEGLQSWENPLLDPPPAGEVAQTAARLRQAELAAEQLQWQTDRAVLRAPCDGVISAVYARPGEWSTPGAPVLEIVDTTRWYVETRNVSELNIGQVRVGQRALVQVLALDKAEVEGIVAAVSPVAVVQQGDTTYTLTIELAETDLNLRPGMNVQVEIRVG